MRTASCGLKNGPSDLLLVLNFKACTSLAVKLASCTSGKTPSMLEDKYRVYRNNFQTCMDR